MSVLNRTLDTSEQKKVYEVLLPAAQAVTGSTNVVCFVPYASTLDFAQIAANGTSGTPTYQLNVDRFIPGAGFTTMVVATGSSNTPGAFGTSGVPALGMVTAAQGSTLLSLLPNDQIVLTTGGANAAARSLSVAVVIIPIQDVKTNFGIR